MRQTSGGRGGLESSHLGTRLEAYEAPAFRMGRALLIALLLHGGFLLYTWLYPPPPATRKSRPIEMELRAKRQPTARPPSQVKPPPSAPPPAASRPGASRSLPPQLVPQQRKAEPSDPKSSAIQVPSQPPSTGETTPPGPLRGPIDLFPKSLNTVIDPSQRAGAIRTRPDTLFQDPLKIEKKEPPFELVPEKGGYKCSTKSFVARISPEGKVTFDDKTIGFEKGSPGPIIDIGDIITRRKGIDPYYAEKRKFREFTEALRKSLREKAAKEYQERALDTFTTQLSGIWSSGRAAAARRRELYEKWADCDDDPLDPSARKGRHAVEDFIRGHLPRSSSDAYSEAELEKIARERPDLPPFDPYGRGTP